MAMSAKMKGKVIAPGTSRGTGGNTGNQPDTSTGPKTKATGQPGLPNTFFGNSRKPVHKNLDRHPHD
jgi:hypothetical protein